MDAFDQQFSIDDSPAPAPAPAPKPASPAPKPDSSTPKPAEPAPKPAEGATPAAKPSTEDEAFETPQTGTLMEVRSWGRRMGQMAKTATAKVKELEAKVEELQSVSHVPPDIARLQQDYTRLQKELQNFQEIQARTDWSQSQEYKTNFHEPYAQAYRRGLSAVSQLVVREPGEEGQFTTRRATEADWEKLYNMTDAEADAAAESMFGPSARRVLALRDTAKERAEMAYEALKNKSSEFAEQRKAGQAQEAQRRLALSGLFTKVNEDIRKKHAQWFGERPGDKEYNEELAKGRQVAQQRFTAAYGKLSPEQRVVLDAQIFNRAAAAPALIKLVKRLETKLAETEQRITAMRGSGPGKPDTTPAGGSPEPETAGDWEKQFDETVR